MEKYRSRKHTINYMITNSHCIGFIGKEFVTNAQYNLKRVRKLINGIESELSLSLGLVN